MRPARRRTIGRSDRTVDRLDASAGADVFGRRGAREVIVPSTRQACSVFVSQHQGGCLATRTRKGVLSEWTDAAWRRWCQIGAERILPHGPCDATGTSGPLRKTKPQVNIFYEPDFHQ